MSATTQSATRRQINLSATYHASRFDLPEGREWLVNDKYVVTVYQDAELGRVASCRCKAFSFGLCCRHIRFVQLADSYLTSAPLREIKPVYN